MFLSAELSGYRGRGRQEGWKKGKGRGNREVGERGRKGERKVEELASNTRRGTEVEGKRGVGEGGGREVAGSLY